MLTYINEIEKTRDKYINSFLYCDFFHDSSLKDIRIENFWKDVYFILSCSREWKEGKIYSETDEIVDYELHFHDCKNFELNLLKEDKYIQYLYGCFKKSAKLLNISKVSHKNYLHLRIELTIGLCDIIFNKFSIRKINWTALAYFKPTSHFDFIKEKFSKVDINLILNIAQGEEDERKAEALEYLWVTWNPQIKLLTLNALEKAEEFDACWYSGVFILWEIWNLDDLIFLKNKFSELDKYWFNLRFHINDALEKIFFRSSSDLD